jgi:menaquinone-9 beta-reductase
MQTAKPITIVGGGLAGLTLGIGLRKRGVPVTLWEAGHYPRHRVCGEFISGRGQDSLARLGLLDFIREQGAVEARTVEFCARKTPGRVRPLPQPALCLPRYQMDASLARRFCELGGSLCERERWHDDAEAEGVVLATGRRLRPVVNGRRWFGLKAHALNVSLKADLEMHVFPNGYVGLCRQPDGVVNVCGLFRSRTNPDGAHPEWQERLRGPEGSLLARRMKDATFAPGSFCAVAGLDLHPQRAESQSGCRIGDALTMIPPVTGNGMSIAFESAELAIEPLAAWSQGELSWTQTRQMVARHCDELLAARLKWAQWLQRATLFPAFQGPLVALSTRSDLLWETMFAKTR